MRLMGIGFDSARFSSTTSSGRVKRAQLAGLSLRDEINKNSAEYPLQIMSSQERMTQLSDSNRKYNRLFVSARLLKQLATIAMKLQGLAERSHYTPEQANQIDLLKHEFIQAMETQLLGGYLLDSSFTPIQMESSRIEFTVPGLDMLREPLTNEVVSLFINQKLVPLGFERLETEQQQLSHFRMVFAHAGLQLRLGTKKEFVIGMLDSSWRKWDGQVYVSGQGSRFAQGAPVSVPAQTIHPVREYISALRLDQSGAKDKVKQVLERVNKMYYSLSKLIRWNEEVISLPPMPQSKNVDAREVKNALFDEKWRGEYQQILAAVNRPAWHHAIELLHKS
ncbi:hypothetical protein ACPV5Q_01035 [Vibrio astriarenae]